MVFQRNFSQIACLYQRAVKVRSFGVSRKKALEAWIFRALVSYGVFQHFKGRLGKLGWTFPRRESWTYLAFFFLSCVYIFPYFGVRDSRKKALEAWIFISINIKKGKNH
uniref:Uncharacterized protein n=1 Tax=Cacopsylla melanoneura TaxID=428564 RepID=A0A8D9E120_9HEMI